jgi:F-type H+-transporting ATPase subunit b
MLIAAVFNLVVLVVVLVRFAGSPIRDFLIQRSRGVARAIEEAEGRLRAAEAEVERWKQRLTRVDQEGAEIMRLVGSQADLERQRRVERARSTADRIRVDADALAEQEVDHARDLLRAEVSEIAASGALSLIRDLLRPEDDRRLVSEYAERIGASS